MSAVIMEPVISSGGFVMPPIGWLRAVRAICDELDVLMIADEVITGFGRTGRWFAVEHDGIVPDLMSVAKGITSGYIPLSASIARGRLADAFPGDATQENVHPNTYAAHPVACAAALATIQLLEEGLVKNAATVGEFLKNELMALQSRRRESSDVRGLGLMIGVEFERNDGSHAPDAKLRDRVMQKCFEKGLLLLSCGESTLRFCPPLIVTEKEAGVAVTLFELSLIHI